MGPNFSDAMNVPKGVDLKNVYKPDPTNEVPLLQSRWVNGETFETFEMKTLESYYNNK